jgi:Family of unknown function (DUF5335)
MRKEIARSEWNTFLDTFSRQHEGWLVTVEEIAGDGGSRRVEARELPLRRVCISPREPSISVALGRAPDDKTYTIIQPARLIVDQTDAGGDRGLMIERQDGQSTRIRFRAAVRPEEVDGLAAPGPPVSR